ncbi:CADPS, partial [Cordylochernes scorpioides]
MGRRLQPSRNVDYLAQQLETIWQEIPQHTIRNLYQSNYTPGGSLHPGQPDGIGTVTVEEKDIFAEIKERLRILLENEITHFRYCFPFGRPEGSLKATLSLLER